VTISDEFLGELRQDQLDDPIYLDSHQRIRDKTAEELKRLRDKYGELAFNRRI